MSNQGKSRLKKETHSSVEKKVRREKLRCSICPPNRGENRKSHKRHGVKKPKYKTDKRKGLIHHGCPPGCPGCAAE